MKMLWVLQYVLMAVVVGLVVLSVLRRRKAGVAPGVVRSASLTEASTLGWWRGLLGSLVPVAVTAAVLAARWESIPLRFTQHWTMSGVHTSDMVANRMVERSVGSVFGLLLEAVVVVLMMGWLGEMTARRSPGFAGREAVLGMTRTALLACAWLVAVLFSAISLLPLCAEPEKVLPVLMVVSLVATLGLFAWVGYRAATSDALMVAAQASTEAKFWKAGLFYVNPQDSALMVPKRFGLGYTLNFGRPMAWVMMGVVVALPVGTLLMAFLGKGR